MCGSSELNLSTSTIDLVFYYSDAEQPMLWTLIQAYLGVPGVQSTSWHQLVTQ